MSPLHGSPAGPAAVLSGQVAAADAARPLSVRDMFRIGVGPSSSHTVGPMRAGRHFAEHLANTGKVTRVVVELMGSLAATGRGHRTDCAVVLGLAGYEPETVPIPVVDSMMDDVEASGTLSVANVGEISFVPSRDIVFLPGKIMPFHVNAVTLRAIEESGEVACERTYYSVGGGFVMEECGDPEGESRVCPLPGPFECGEPRPAPFPYSTADGLLRACDSIGGRISDVVLANELALMSEDELDATVARLVAAMDECVEAGMSTQGTLPGGLNVLRRAPRLLDELRRRAASDEPADELSGMDWVNLYALAVNEENASGHRVVTAPTNGAAGIIPAVLTYYRRGKNVSSDDVRRFMLAATAIGGLIKTNASIAGAEVGCQGEVGSACAMAAAGLAEAMGGTPRQVENAAEIAMEHCLGLTCDPVAGLVQIPCIERNAIASVKAINAARMALWGDGRHTVSFDTVIETMRQTGEDMLAKYKETSRGGLAVNVVEC